jgi:hypothetical protein
MNGNTVHRSVANRSSSPRIAGVLRIANLAAQQSYERERFYSETDLFPLHVSAGLRWARVLGKSWDIEDLCMSGLFGPPAQQESCDEQDSHHKK